LRGGIDSTHCEALVTRTVGGDEGAWQALVAHLWVELRGFVRTSRTMGSFGRSDDHVNDVLTRLVERLRRDDSHGLRLYAPWRARNPEKTFADWIRIVTSNIMRRYVHDQLGPAVEDGGTPLPSVKRLLNEFVQSPVLEELGVRPPITDAQTAQELLTFARMRLPEGQCAALMLWIEGASFEEIAGELGLREAKAAERAVRAATAVLRRHFVGAAGAR